MATSRLPLPAVAAQLDPTNTPGVELVNGIRYILFDDTTVEEIYFEFVLPEDFASALSIKLKYSMDTATSGTVEFEVSVWKLSDDDAADTESYAAVNNGSVTVPGTAKDVDTISITLTNDDGVAGGDLVRIRIARDADDGTNDTATGDARFHGAILEYTA